MDLGGPLSRWISAVQFLQLQHNIILCRDEGSLIRFLDEVTMSELAEALVIRRALNLS
jgi:hypothetical protein